MSVSFVTSGFLLAFFLLQSSAFFLDVWSDSQPQIGLECDSKEAVTQAYLVRGLGAQFHCPYNECVWQAAHFPGYNRSNSYFITNATSDLNGGCLPCEDGRTGKFTLFNITVDEQRNMTFATDVDSCNHFNDTTTKCTLPLKYFKYFNSSNNYYFSIAKLTESLSCKVGSGYPPFRTITWLLDQEHWKPLENCTFPNDRNQTLTYVVDPELNEHIRVNNGKIRDVQCIVENGVEVLIGVRTVQLDATHAAYNVQPLQAQTSGVVEVEPGGVANITCASNSQVRLPRNYRVCRVNYTKLDARQRCLRERIAPESDCCTAHRCFKNSTFDPYSSNDFSYKSALFMTSLPGSYQCQAINAWTSTWQSIGDPVRVVVKQLEEESPVSSTSVPSPTLSIPSTGVLSPTLSIPSTGVTNASFQIPLIASVSAAAVVIAVLLIVISALLCKLYRSKLKFSTQTNSSHLNGGSLSEHLITVEETELCGQRASGPGMRKREVGQVPNSRIAREIQVATSVSEDREPAVSEHTESGSQMEGDRENSYSVEKAEVTIRVPEWESTTRGREPNTSVEKLVLPAGLHQTIRDGSPNRASHNSRQGHGSQSANGYQYMSVPTISADAEVPEQSQLRKRVQQVTTDFINGLDVDALLLASMVSDSLLTETQRQMLHSKLDAHKPQIEVNSYFLNVIVLNWPYVLFDNHLSKFCEVLRNHSSPGNTNLGETLRKILSETNVDQPQ